LLGDIGDMDEVDDEVDRSKCDWGTLRDGNLDIRSIEGAFPCVLKPCSCTTGDGNSVRESYSGETGVRRLVDTDNEPCSKSAEDGEELGVILMSLNKGKRQLEEDEALGLGIVSVWAHIEDELAVVCAVCLE
jgi:hypothetical protein